jgi:tRNA-Thr(GGU) m(6)t(6)A37 methyltransferase TsaA
MAMNNLNYLYNYAMEIKLQPVAYVINSRSEPVDDNWSSIVSEIELAGDITDEAFAGINSFSHLEVLFYFDKAQKNKVVFSGHLRGNTAYPKVGIFAQRKKDRPNSLGLTTVELVRHEGRKIIVKNLDAINGTPILDIKPVMKEFQPKGEINQPEWSIDLMKNYW